MSVENRGFEKVDFSAKRSQMGSIVPLEGLGHGAIEVVDEVKDFGLEVSLTGETGPSQQLPHENGEPDFDLIEPGTMLRREMDDQTMLWIG